MDNNIFKEQFSILEKDNKVLQQRYPFRDWFTNIQQLFHIVNFFVNFFFSLLWWLHFSVTP